MLIPAPSVLKAGNFSYPRGRYQAKLANNGLIGKLHITSEMDDNDVTQEICSVFKHSMPCGAGINIKSRSQVLILVGFWLGLLLDCCGVLVPVLSTPAITAKALAMVELSAKIILLSCPRSGADIVVSQVHM